METIPRHSQQKPAAMYLYGISEWQSWYGHYDLIPAAPETAIDECIDVHLAAGFTHLVWNAGRSTLDYWSDLPGHTRSYAQPSGDEGSSAPGMRPVMQLHCPMRRALSRCHREGIPLLARLAMNRHYGIERNPGISSTFAAEHPEYHERSRSWQAVTGKLCYAIEDVQQERLDILLELQRIGVDGLLLDFCRQMPILLYHEALVEPYRKRTGVDPREIESEEFADFRDWFQYRSDILTGFMSRLRDEVRRQEAGLGLSCPIVARVPDGPQWLLLAYGLDLERWFRDDLIDASMLSPFPLSGEDPGRHFEYHVEIAHREGKPCIGGLGSLGLFRHNHMGREHPWDYEPKPIYEILHHQYEAGCDAMSVYQTETLARKPYLTDLLRESNDPEVVARRVRELPGRARGRLTPQGLDWHARFEGELSWKSF